MAFSLPSSGSGSVARAGRPGRPRSFDPALALAAALGIFLRRGYGNVSLSELTEGMGISRPSFYAAFGNKEALFTAALDLHARRHRALLDQALAAPSAQDVALRLLRNALAYPDLAGGAGGFLGFLSSLPASAGYPSVRGAIMAHRGKVMEAMTARFTQAQLPPTLRPQMLPFLLEALTHGIAANMLAGMLPADGEDLLQQSLGVVSALFGSAAQGIRPKAR